MKASEFLVKAWDLLGTLDPKTFKELCGDTKPLPEYNEEAQKAFFDTGTLVEFAIANSCGAALELTIGISKRGRFVDADNYPVARLNMVSPLIVRSYLPKDRAKEAIEMCEHAIELCKFVQRFTEMFSEVKITEYPKW